MLRTLAHHWRVHLAVVCGAAVAAAVLAGALLVGDSVRGSLRALTLDRLGHVDHALVTDRFFRADLVDSLAARPRFDEHFTAVVPAIVLRGSATHPDSGSRASRIGIHGVDDRFTGLFPGSGELDFARRPGQVFPSVWINASLQRELGVEIGEALLLSFGRFSQVPRETLMGEKDPAAVLGALRLTLVGVVPDRGLGRFGLAPRQQNPSNAFVALDPLQRALDQREQINAVFLAAVDGRDDDPRDMLGRALRLEDFGLTIERGKRYLALESREFVLRPAVDEAIETVVTELGGPMMRTQSYLANAMEIGDRMLPYSLIAALDPMRDMSWASLRLTDGSPAPVLTEAGILLNAWAAEDLGAAVGDAVETTYYVVGPREELREERTTFRVEGIVAMRDLGADADLTPNYPGIQDAEDISAWDPPFPVELDRIRTRDELYWDRHGAAPKAFVSESTGRRLWSTRFGSTTAIRIGLPPGLELRDTEDRVRRGLAARLAPETFGFRFRPVKREGLEAAAGATDFAMLFVSFSFFLIVSAAMLVGLLFRLGVEQRSGEIGLLLAVGYRVRAVLRGLLVEGALLAGIGGLIGLAGGVGFAWLMMLGLRTIWQPAVGSSELYLYASPVSLAIGWVGTLAVVLLSVWLAVRKLVRLAPPRLLAGATTAPRARGPGKISRLLAYGGLVGGVALVAFAFATGALQNPGLAFGAGSLLLISGLAFFARWCRGSRSRSVSGLGGMSARNSAWNPGRSILCVALVGSACFMIVIVEVFRVDPGHELQEKSSAGGGFALVAEADVPLLQDLDRESDRFELGFSEQDTPALEGVKVYPFRTLPGDDASCLNLYRPERPTLLGASPEFVQRGGFAFQQVIDPPQDGESWSILERDLGPGVIPAVADVNSAMWILHLGLGDELALEDEQGRPLRLRLVGLLKKGIFQSEVLISEANLLDHFPSQAGDTYFLIEAPRERNAEVAQLFERRLGAFGLDATTVESKLADYEVVNNTYLSTFQVLGGLGLLLGTLGLGIVLVRNVIERRGELATLRAFGFRRSRLAWMVLTENGFLLLLGMSLGALAALVAVAPDLVAGSLPWQSLVLTLAVIALVGMLACIAAVLGTLRVPLLPALKAER